MIKLDLFKPFGKSRDGAVNISEGFSVDTGICGYTECITVSLLSSYSGNSAPKIKFSLTVMGEDKPLYTSHSYRIGRENEFTRQTFRVPPLFLPEIRLSLSIEVPEGTVLSVKALGANENTPSTRLTCGPRHNAHLGFWGLAPDNTMPAFELAAASGFPACIAVPKVTGDGKLVCIHDDTINRTARDKNGNPPAEPIYVWDKSYAELSEWEYGSYKNKIYKGTRLPLLSDFFDLCAKTGMRPMFSTHPGLTVEQWKEVKEMLSRRSLLKSFHIKSFGIDILKTAYSVFGNEIEGYTFDIGKWQDSHIETLLSSGIDKNVCRVGIEVQFDEYTEEIADKIRSAGFFASAWNVKRRDFSEYERLMSYGVTEFTEDYHASMGLNY
jgi:glycerophosphoryl diester phosphodiesterase